MISPILRSLAPAISVQVIPAFPEPIMFIFRDNGCGKVGIDLFKLFHMSIIKPDTHFVMVMKRIVFFPIVTRLRTVGTAPFGDFHIHKFRHPMNYQENDKIKNT